MKTVESSGNIENRAKNSIGNCEVCVIVFVELSKCEGDAEGNSYG